MRRVCVSLADRVSCVVLRLAERTAVRGRAGVIYRGLADVIELSAGHRREGRLPDPSIGHALTDHAAVIGGGSSVFSQVDAELSGRADDGGGRGGFHYDPVSISKNRGNACHRYCVRLLRLGQSVGSLVLVSQLPFSEVTYRTEYLQVKCHIIPVVLYVYLRVRSSNNAQFWSL